MILALVQARMGSTRLPGKVLADLAGKPVLQHVIERTQEVRSADHVEVLTTSRPENYPVMGLCRRLNVKCYTWTGDESDVLGRFAACLRRYYDRHWHRDQPEYVLRVCADSPLLDPMAADELLAAAVGSDADYCAYSCDGETPLLGSGYFAEVADVQALLRLDRDLPAGDPRREHVTQGLYTQPELYLRYYIPPPAWWLADSRPVVIDTAEDLARLQEELNPN